MTNMRSLKPALARLGRKLVSATSWLTARIFDRVDWHAPEWLSWLRRQPAEAVGYFNAERKRSAVFLLVILAVVGGLLWYLNLPVPHHVAYAVTAPALTEYNERGISKIFPLKVGFAGKVSAYVLPVRHPRQLAEDKEPHRWEDSADIGNDILKNSQPLILVTDLGFVVKQAKDGTRDVFVQSIRSGMPVDGARVEVIGRNGEPVLAATTGEGGRAQLPKTSDFRREKAPLMVLARKDEDFSFMPFRTSARTLDLSRFDTGGVKPCAIAGS